MLLAFLPIVWLLAELFVAVAVAHAIGAGYMLLLLIASWPLLRGRLARHLQGRFASSAARFGGARRSYDVDSTASDVDQSQLSA